MFFSNFFFFFLIWNETEVVIIFYYGVYSNEILKHTKKCRAGSLVIDRLPRPHMSDEMKLQKGMEVILM